MTRPLIPAVNVTSHYTQSGGSYNDSFTGPPPGYQHNVVVPDTVVTSGTRTYHRDAHTRQIPSHTSDWRQPSAWNHSDFGSYFLNAQILQDQLGLSPPHFYRATLYGNQAISASLLPAMNGSPPSFLENSCISGALAKLQDQAVNLATNLVERKQTEELVGDTINIIRRSIQLFKDKKPASWNRLKQAFKKHPLLSEKRAGQVPDEWLKLQYGWNPLMSDVQGAFSKIERREADGLADRVTVKKLVRYSALTSPTLSTGIGGTSLLLRRDSKYLGHISLTYRLTNFPLAQFSSLGLVNPAYLIWEELPFSFVIDWFAPIGNVLNSWTADFGWTYMGGCFSSKVSENLDTARCNSNTSGIYTYSISGNVQGFSEIFSRKVYASSPVARFYLKNPLSSLHVSEALSLLIQVFR